MNLFEGKEIRSIWDAEKKEYFFSVVDVIGALTDSKIPKRYWTDLKRKMTSEEGSQLYEKIVQLKMKSFKDGKMYLTDTLDTEEILRLIESVPSKKAEPFKLWLASLGKERIDEVVNPEIATRELAKKHKPQGLKENRKIAKAGGEVAKTARDDLEGKLGETIISKDNNLNYKYLDDNKLLEKENRSSGKKTLKE